MTKILPPVLFLFALIVMVILWIYLPINRFVSYPFNLIGVLFIVFGVGLSVLGSKKFRERATNINTFKDPNVLVTDGLFSYSRNPMYLGFVIALAGFAWVLGVVSAVFIPVLFYVITHFWYIKFEEQAMLKVFGDDYLRYKSKTRRWI